MKLKMSVSEASLVDMDNKRLLFCLWLNVLRCVYIRSGVLYRKTTRLLLCGLKIWDLVGFINICWIFMEMDCDICYYIYVDVRWMLNCPVWGMLFLGNVWNLYYCRSIKCTHTTWWNLKYDVHKNRKKMHKVESRLMCCC